MYTSINFRLIEPHYFSHLWAKHLEVDALWECNGGIEQKCNWGQKSATSGHKSVTGAWLHGLLQYMVYSWARECNYKLNAQPAHEWVTASPKLNTRILCEKGIPNYPKLLKIVHQKGFFPSSKTILKLLLKEMGFKFKKHNGRKFVMEQPQVISQRHSFLRKVMKRGLMLTMCCQNAGLIVMRQEEFL